LEELMANQNRPWLIAAWPGMGNVAIIAAGFLVQKLGMEPAGELPPSGHFDVQEVEVREGIITRPRVPRSVFYRWRNPAGRDLIVFLGEAQPSTGSYAFAHEMLERASKFGIERIITFASMASQLHPSKDPRVFAVATDKAVLSEIDGLKVEALEEGQISGLNGLLLGAGAERELAGICLLGEIPFFAAGVPNPKAARAVLTIFAKLAKVDVELGELDEHVETVDRALIDLLEQMREQQGEEGGIPADIPLPEEPGDDDEDEEPEEQTPPPPQKKKEPAIDPAARQRIRQLFDEAKRDRQKAFQLKEELDRLGVFSQYEDQFLNLFRRGE
jgi:uncharacterized protein